jgi:hypothetical protein
MTQLYIIEVQKNANGEFGHNVFYVWDEDQTKARLKAESKYHEVLAAAAISEVAEHAAILFTSEGFPLMHQCYKHDVATVEETTEEPTEPEAFGGEV